MSGNGSGGGGSDCTTLILSYVYIVCNVLAMYSRNISISLTRRLVANSPTLGPITTVDPCVYGSMRCCVLILQPRYILQTADRATETGGFGVDSAARLEESVRISVTRGGWRSAANGKHKYADRCRCGMCRMSEAAVCCDGHWSSQTAPKVPSKWECNGPQSASPTSSVAS